MKLSKVNSIPSDSFGFYVMSVTSVVLLPSLFSIITGVYNKGVLFVDAEIVESDGEIVYGVKITALVTAVADVVGVIVVVVIVVTLVVLADLKLELLATVSGAIVVALVILVVLVALTVLELLDVVWGVMVV